MSANYTPNQNEYKNLTPFKTWLMLQINTWGMTNFPFVESDFDELTNYGMMQKLMKAVNDVIANENEVEQDMTNLFNAFTELQDYVNDYFDNLDVQDEINAKLDQMAYDGSLTALIKNYIDPIYQAYETEIDDEVSTLNARVNALSSGSPLVASSISGMTDTSRVYVNTSDGKWYYYDGDSWEIGGTYQATQLENNSITYELLDGKIQKDFTMNENLVSNVDKMVGTYLNYQTGDTFSLDAYTTSDFIEVKPNTLYYVCRNNLETQGVRYCEYGNDKTYLNIYHATPDITDNQFTTSANTHYIRVSSKTTSYDNHIILCENLLQYITNRDTLLLNGNEISKNSINGESIKDNTLSLTSFKEYKVLSDNLYNPDNILTANCILNANTGLYYNISDYSVTDYQKIESNTAYSTYNVYRVSLFDVNKNYIQSFTSDTSQYLNFTTPSNAVFYRLSVHNSNIGKIKLGKGATAPTDSYKYEITGFTNNAIISSNISDILYNTNNIIKIKLIGDSITYGVGATAGHSWADLLKNSLESKFNCQVVNSGLSGINSEYLVTHIDTLIEDNDNIVICMIGTNNRIRKSSFDRLFGDLQTLYNYCKERDIKFIPMCSLPAGLTDEERENGTFNVRYKHMDDIENVISAFSVANNLEFIDLYEKVYMYCMTKGITINSLLADGLHPNDTGYYLMFRFITHCLGVDAKLENATW